jgi:hypothetical protein
MIAFTGSMVMVPAVANASFKGDACQGVNDLSGTPGNNCDPNAGNKVENLVSAVIKILSYIVGIAAVIMVMIGGFKYITANGDSGAMASARSTIIYALIGLVIAALAQVLVHFVIKKTI